MEQVVLYTTGCPRCKVLESKLNIKGIAYTEVNDIDEMVSLGIETAPVLKVGDKLLKFAEAVDFANKGGVLDV